MKDQNRYEPCVFYTGGGIWLAARYLTSYDHIYAVVDSDCPDCITFYDDRYDDDPNVYECQVMVDSRGLDEMTLSDKVVWEELKEALEKERW